jgi:hypothetical protein
MICISEIIQASNLGFHPWWVVDRGENFRLLGYPSTLYFNLIFRRDVFVVNLVHLIELNRAREHPKGGQLASLVEKTTTLTIKLMVAHEV